MHEVSERGAMQRRYLRAAGLRKSLMALGLAAMLALACIAGSAFAASGAAAAAALDARVEHLSAELRCMVCDNQTIADSNAQLARDIKNVVREQLAAGRSEDDVASFLTQRYGDVVLYRPPVRASTWPLWFGPFLLLGCGLWWLWRTLKGNV